VTVRKGTSPTRGGADTPPAAGAREGKVFDLSRVDTWLEPCAKPEAVMQLAKLLGPAPVTRATRRG